VNNRKILSGIAEVIGHPDKLTDITVAIDKIDKIGLDNVNAELREKGLPDEAVEALRPILLLEGDNAQKQEKLAQLLAGSETGMKGLEKMRFVLDAVAATQPRAEVLFDSVRWRAD